MKADSREAGMTVSLGRRRPSGGNGTANLATRYLCIAPYLRRAMLPARIVEPVTLAERPPLPVGRKYALRFLYGVEGNLPMPDVDIEMVRQHCGAALRQTIL